MAIKNSQEGFTLIELLVVISILSLLASIVYAGVQVVRVRAMDTVHIQFVRQYALALAQAYWDDGQYPDPPPGPGGSFCLGLQPSERCWNDNFAGNSTLNTRLSQYINIRRPTNNGFGFDASAGGNVNYDGAVYQCSHYTNGKCTGFRLKWVLHGTSASKPIADARCKATGLSANAYSNDWNLAGNLTICEVNPFNGEI
jgi:prepilin-type N-terminal cleavage/methylation domain-containing protein